MIVAGLLVIATMSRLPDLLIGTGIGIYVLKEATEILRDARTDAHSSAAKSNPE